jgi:hypothetical protein
MKGKSPANATDSLGQKTAVEASPVCAYVPIPTIPICKNRTCVSQRRQKNRASATNLISQTDMNDPDVLEVYSELLVLFKVPSQTELEFANLSNSQHRALELFSAKFGLDITVDHDTKTIRVNKIPDGQAQEILDGSCLQSSFCGPNSESGNGWSLLVRHLDMNDLTFYFTDFIIRSETASAFSESRTPWSITPSCRFRNAEGCRRMLAMQDPKEEGKIHLWPDCETSLDLL